MDKIEKIRQEIERQIGYAKNTNYPKGSIENERATAIIAVCLDILSFLDSLSEEPDKSLEEAAEKYCEKINHRQTTIITDSFKAGAEWQKKRFEAEYELDWLTDLKKDLYELGRKDEREQMMKEAVEGEVIKTDKHTSVRYKSFYGTDRYFYGIADKQFKPGDKVRILVLKAEEENK